MKSDWQTLNVYDLLESEVTTLIDEFKQARIFQGNFNANKLSI